MWVSALGSATEAESEPTVHIQDDVIFPIQKLDDEITSLVASGSTTRATTPNTNAHQQTEDIVVGEASLVPELREALAPRERHETLDDGVNVGAHEDQDIRLEIMARGGNQDALQQARERLRKRRMVTLKLPVNPAAVLTTGTVSADPIETVAEFDADGTDATTFDQQVNRRPGDEAQPSQTNPRNRRSGLPARAYNDPMPPVPAHEIKPGQSGRPKARHEQDLFDTVPAVDPEFELPLMDAATREQELRDANEFTDDDVFLPEEKLSSYELVLQRARAIRAATRTGHAQGQPGATKTPSRPRRTTTPDPVPAPAKAAAPAPAMVRHQPAARNEHLMRQDRREAFALTEEPSIPSPAPEVPVRRSPPAKPRGRFDVSMLISRGVSFYRQDPASSTATETPTSSSPLAEWNDEYDSIEEPVTPIQRRPTFSRSGETQSAGMVEADEVFAEHHLESSEDTYAEDDVLEAFPADDPLHPIPGTEDNDAGELAFDHEPEPDARFRAPSDAPSRSDTPVRQRDLYRSGDDADIAEVPRHRRDVQTGRELDPSPSPRDDYRIRTSYVEENVFAEEYDDASPGFAPQGIAEQEWQTYSDFESVSRVAVNEWSFEPQGNLDLRQASDMDAFRARLFNKAPQTPRTTASHTSQADRITPAAAARPNDDRVQRIQARSADMPTATPKSSPLRSSSFEREEQPPRDDREPGERISQSREDVREEPGNSSYPLVKRDPTFDLRDVLDHQGDMLDMTLSLAPELPRSCRTCRDFRPSESGDRGWCNNAWAFTHSQMVDADDLACQSTIGCWWTPYDEVWLPEVRETAPTPRVAQMVTAGGTRKRSG